MTELVHRLKALMGLSRHGFHHHEVQLGWQIGAQDLRLLGHHRDHFEEDVLVAVSREWPGLGQELQRYDEAAKAGKEAALVKETYAGLPAVSIDHGIMEKVSAVSVVPGSFEWSDLGSWTSAWELAPQDDMTLVRFRHAGWPSENAHYFTSCYCWAMYLRILKRFVEHGETVPYESRLDV